MGQLNTRVPQSTEEQIAYLIAETGMTRTQIVILAIDKLAQAHTAERGMMSKWTVEKAAWTNQRLEYETDMMRQQDLRITPETLSEFFTEHEGLPLGVQEAADWLATQNWYKSKQDMTWSDEAQAYFGTTSDGRRVRVEASEMANAARSAGINIADYRQIKGLKDPDIWAGLVGTKGTLSHVNTDALNNKTDFNMFF